MQLLQYFNDLSLLRMLAVPQAAANVGYDGKPKQRAAAAAAKASVAAAYRASSPDPALLALADKENELSALQAVRLELEQVRLLSDQIRR